MGYLPAHQEETGRLPLQGGTQVDGATYKEEEVWDVGFTPTIRGYGRGGYFTRRYNTDIQYIETRSIMELCMAAKRHPGTRVTKR